MKITTNNAPHRDKFVVGEEYWTFYMELTNKGNSLRNVVRVFKTKLLKTEHSNYELNKKHLTFSVPEDLEVSDIMRHNLPTYMNGYGYARCDFYTSEEEAIKAFDQKICELANYQKASDRDKMLKKRYVQTPIKLSVNEIDAINWKDTLTDEQKGYLNWFLENK